ncbi:MAG: PKD domain-containing protein [Fluviicola sp.]|nr:PKD domain-containing protein [Fluviicola sp.]
MAFFLFGGAVSQAQTVTNGSFTGMTGNSVTPPGWTNVTGYNPGSGIGSWPSVDVLDLAFSSYFGSSTVAAALSPNGGTWTGISSIPPGMENEAIEQVVPGFTIGTTYQLSFYAANFGGSPFDDPGVVTGYINGTAVAVSPTLNLVPNVWTYVSGTFIASATSMTVQMDAIHNTGDAGAGGYYSVDGVEIIPLTTCLAGNNPPTLSATSVCLTTPTFDLTGITASNTPASTSLTWHSATPATNANTLAVANAVTEGTYYAAFYDAVNDCYSPTTAFNVYPVPAAAFTAPTVCSNSPSSFTDQSTVSSGTISGWAWSFGDGGTSLVQNPSHTYIGAGATYNVTLLVTTPQGCTNSITQSVTTNEPPVAAFTAQAGCANNPVAFTDQSTIASGTIVAWNWNFGDGSNSALQNPTHQYAAASNYNVTLTVTSDLGCTNSITIQVSTTAPVAAFTSTVACENSPVNFTDQSTISAGNITGWAWDFGDGSNSAVQNPNHAYTAAGNYTVTLLVTSNLGCTNSVTQQVTVAPIPVAAFTAPNACSGVPVNFTDLSTVATGTITDWDWTFGDGGSAAIRNPIHTFNTGGNYSVTLTVTSNIGCTNSITQPVIITTTPTASFDFTPNDPDILNPTVQFINTSSNGVSYNWDFGGLGGSTQTSPAYTFPEEPGSYTVTLIAYSGTCTDTVKSNIAIKDVVIYYVPNSFTPDGDEFNQTFQPVFTNGFDPYDFNMQIFNRWGEVIFESNDATVGWDGSYHGKLVSDGIYTWKIEFKTLATDERMIIHGNVNKLQ